MKSMKIKVDKIICEVCSTIFKVRPFRISAKNIMEVNGRVLPKKHLPEHKCNSKK